MDILYAVIAAVIGSALGWAQFRILQLTVAKGTWWLLAVKLPLWAVFMLAAAAVSVTALVVFVAFATVTFLAFGCVYWRKRNKGV